MMNVMHSSEMKHEDGSALVRELSNVFSFIFVVIAFAGALSFLAYRREIVKDRRDELVSGYEQLIDRLRGQAEVGAILDAGRQWGDLLHVPIHTRSLREDSAAILDAREQSRGMIVREGADVLVRDGEFIALDDGLHLILLLRQLDAKSSDSWKAGQEVLLRRVRNYLVEVGQVAATPEVLRRSIRIAGLAADVSSGDEREWFYGVYDLLQERLYALAEGRDTDDLSAAKKNARRDLAERLRGLFQGDRRLAGIYVSGSNADSLVLIGTGAMEELASIFHGNPRNLDSLRAAGFIVVVFRGVNGELPLELR